MRFKDFMLEEETSQLNDWHNYIKSSPELSSAVKILDKITSKGYKAYIVGGAVRDLILDVKPKDFDIATNMSIEDIEKLYKIHDIGKSKDFGIVTIGQDGFQFEVAQFRSDGSYTDGRRPDKIKIEGSFEQDAARRDFTLSAMAIDKDGNIIDYFDGKKDIKNKVIKAVGDPRERFKEDSLRIMRSARFSSKLDFTIDPDTKKAAKELSHTIKNLSPERIKDEIFKAASSSGDRFAKYLIELDEMGILEIILPEIVKQKSFRQWYLHHPEGAMATRISDNKTEHYDFSNVEHNDPTKYKIMNGNVWDHTIAALKANDIMDPIINISILLHDVGKPSTATMKTEDAMSFFGHAEKGMELVDEIAKKLKLSNFEKERIIFAVGNHMKFHDLLKLKPSKVFKLVSDDNWDCLVAVAKADNFSRGPNFKYHDSYDDIVNKAIEIKEKWGEKTMQKAIKYVSGFRIMELTGLKPSKKVGKIIKIVTDTIIDDNIDPNDQGIIDKLIMKTYGELT
jgi:tRNA nucleotidyltransferase/poly(A) polymerase